MRHARLLVPALLLLALACAGCGGDDGGDDDSANFYASCPVENQCKGGLECLPALLHPDLDSYICSQQCQVVRSKHDPDAGQCQPHPPCTGGCCWITSHVIPQEGEEYFGGVCAPTPL